MDRRNRLFKEIEDNWNWRGIVQDARDNWYVENSNVDPKDETDMGRCFLGTVQDMAYMEALEAVASKYGGWIESGEGDPCELFFVMEVEKDKYLHQIITGVLTENTGRHFLDSGGAYGRHWERNQGRSFRDEPVISVEIDGGQEDGSWEYANVVFNVYHFLMGHLSVDADTGKLNREFTRFSLLPGNEERHWLDLMEEFAGGYEEHYGFNTYNSENLLSQVLQGEMFEHEGETYVLLQVHGGCDVRGGYTAPRIFKVVDRDYFWLAMVDIVASCNGQKFDPRQECLPGIELSPYCQNNWTSDDSGYHWYFDGCSSDENPIHEYAIYDPETETLKCRECGGEIHFNVMDQF